MRPSLRVISRTILTLLLFFTAALILADETARNLVAVVLDSFDEPDKSVWIVKGSKFITEGYPEQSFVKTYPEALFGKNKENKVYSALGIHGKFDRKAYNYVELIPAKKDKDGKLVPSPLPIPGIAKAIDLWVWGSNYNYYMEVHVRDFMGVDHVLPMGNMLYAGWRNLSTDIPGSIPQTRRYIPRFQGLELTEFVIWTRPDEKVDDFYVFVDHVKVLTDMFIARFDGDDLADLDTLNQLWSAGAPGTK